MTAIDLLHKYLEYTYLWDDPHRVDSKPARARLQQIEALQDAFGLSKKHADKSVHITYSTLGEDDDHDRSEHLRMLTELEYLGDGEFLHDRPMEIHEEVFKAIQEIVLRLGGQSHSKRVQILSDLSWFYSDLLNFRIRAYALIHPPGPPQTGFSVGLYQSHVLQFAFIEAIQQNLDDIDDALALILDPQKRKYDLSTLVDDFGYPNVDLEMLDHEWKMEDY